MQVNPLTVLRRFLLYLLPLVAMVGGISAVFIWREGQQHRQILEHDFHHYADMAVNLISRQLLNVKTDLDILARKTALRDFALDRESPAVRSVSEDWSALLVHKKVYDNITLLNLEGRELLRLDLTSRQTRRVAAQELRDKSSRYYFSRMAALDFGEYYLSPLDLNVENEVIELPFKPVLRFATPVLDSEGNKIAILKLNFNSRTMFQELNRLEEVVPGELLLINREGYWLKGPDPEDEWGFMFPGKQDRKFARDYPASWDIIGNFDSVNTYLGSEGLFIAHMLNPRQLLNREVSGISPGKPVFQDRDSGLDWNIITHISAQDLQARQRGYIHDILRLAGFFILVAMPGIALQSWSRERRRRAEEELKRHRDQLETMVAERTSALQAATRQLQQALVRAEQADHLKTVFLENMSHEIRTPLNSILGFTELIEDSLRERLSLQEKAFFKSIHSSSQRLLKTVHEILDISRIETGTYEFKPVTVNLIEILDQLVSEFHPAVREKGLKISYRKDCGEAGFHGDEYSLTQALSNLIDNAVKYTRKGFINIHLSREAENLVLVIQDSGIGVAPEYLDHIYDLFSQESSGFTKKYQGLGLGLSLTKRYLDMNRVAISVDSRLDEGTTFRLMFTAANTTTSTLEQADE